MFHIWCNYSLLIGNALRFVKHRLIFKKIIISPMCCEDHCWHGLLDGRCLREKIDINQFINALFDIEIMVLISVRKSLKYRIISWGSWRIIQL